MLPTEITKSHLNNRVYQHCGVKTSTVTPSFCYVFNISLSCNINIPSFIGNLWWVLLLGNHLNFCKDHRDKIEVPDPLAVEDLISCKLSNKRKLARLITQYRDMFFPIFRRARPLPSSGCYREWLWYLKYGKYDITSEKILESHPEEGRPCFPKYWEKYIPILCDQPC